MNKLNELKTGITTRSTRDGRSAEVDLIDATDEEVEVWFEQKRRYGENIISAALKSLLNLIRFLNNEMIEDAKQQEVKKVKK